MPEITIDWEGLSRSLQQNDLLDFSTPYPQRVGPEFDRTPGKGTGEFNSGNLTFDVSGLWNQFDFKADDWNKYWQQTQGAQLNKDAQGFNVFDFVLNDVPDFLGNAVFDVVSFQTNPLKALQRKYYQKLLEDPKGALEYAKLLKEKFPQILANNDPNVLEEIGMGVEEGITQNISLLGGGEKPTTYASAKQEAMDKAILEGYKAGIISEDEFVRYRKWRSDFQANTGIAFDLAAATTNSLLIMGELVATGNIAAFTTQGLKVGSGAWMKAYGKGILEQGVKTWKVLGAGANIKALGDATETIREENLNLGEALVEIAANGFKENLGAFAEGASEGVLLGLKLGSVPLKKWLGVPIKQAFQEVGVVGRRTGLKTATKLTNKYFNAKELKDLIKATTNPVSKVEYANALSILRQNRKDIVKQIAKNTGTKTINGIFFETATEQLTDMLQDAFDPNSHASVLNLLNSDEEIRSGALKNLIVEMGVGLLLGFGMGFGEIWARKPMEELEKKYGPQVANSVKEMIEKPENQEKFAALIIDKNMPLPGTGLENVENNAVTMQDLGSKETIPTEDESDVKALAGARANLPADIADVIQKVEQIEVPNILDFTMMLGQKQFAQYSKNVAAQSEGVVIPETFLSQATPETINAMSSIAYDNILTAATSRGLMDRVNWVKESDLELKRDLTVGIAMQFDKLGWGYVRSKYSTNPDIDFAIDEADKITDSDVELKVPDALTGRLYGAQSVKKVQALARATYIKSISDTKHALLKEETFIAGGSVDYIFEPRTEEAPPAIELEGGRVEFMPDDIGESFDDDGFRHAAQERPVYKAVALRANDGTIYEGQIGMQHADLAYGSSTVVPLNIANRSEYGFVDWDGNFVSRDDVDRLYGVRESINMKKAGLLPKTGERFQGQIPDATFSLPKYKTVLPDVKETTFLELAKWFENKGMVNETTKEVLSLMMPIIGHRKVTFDNMGDEHAGGTDVYTLESTINTEAIMYKSTSAFDTMVHEGLHSYLMGYMDQNTDLSNKFVGQVRGVMNAVRSVINAPQGSAVLDERWTGSYNELRSYVKANDNLLRKALKNEEEFITSVMSDTQAMKWISDRVMIGGPTRKLTGWKKLWASIAGVLKKESTIPVSATRKLQQDLEEHSKFVMAMNTGLNKKFNVALARENKRLASNISSMFMDWETFDENEDDQDDFQTADDVANEDENRVENQTINNFVSFMARASNITEGAFREHIRSLTFSAYKQELDKFNKENTNIINRKLERMYSGYKHIWPTFGEFKSQFMKRQYLNIVNKTAKISAIVQSSSTYDPAEGRSNTGFEVRLVKGTYVDGKGSKRNTYKETIALENFVPKLEEMLGLDPKTFQVVFIDGFETIKDGQVTRRNSFDRLRKEFFHDYQEGSNEPITGRLADWLWSNAATNGSAVDYLYLGNFAKKNTLPVLAFKSSQATKDKIREGLARYETVYANTAVEAFGEEYDAETKESRRMSQTARSVLESLWFNHEFAQSEAGQWSIKDPKVATQDWNKIMKRATKWLIKQTQIVLTPEDIKDKFANRDLSGITMVGRDANIRAGILNSYDDKMVTLKFMGTEINVSLKDLLVNEFGTPIFDGASVYIIGQFDELYLTANGALKSGIIKNVYGSTIGEHPAFIKHAMHGVHKDSILGQWMIQNNLAMLISDESMKEGKEHYTPISGADLADPKAFIAAESLAMSKDQEVVVNLKLSNFQRIKEIENVDTMGGSTKQLFNGTALSDLYNPALQEAVKKSGVKTKLNDILLDFTHNNHVEATKWFEKNTTPYAILDLVRNIIAEPKSPLEESVSNVWGNLLEKKEGQDEQDIIDKYSGAFDHALTAEALKNRLQHRMAQLLGGKTAGMRGGLTPNMGYLNHKRDIEPITQHYNLADILVSEFGNQVPREVLEAALPEAGLLTIVRKLQDVSRAESRAHNDLEGHEKARRIRGLQDLRMRYIQQINALGSERLNSIVTANSNKVAVHRLINWKAPQVQTWMNEVVWGKQYEEGGVKQRDESGILNIKHGRLRSEWQIVPEDFANKFGVKPGDWVLDNITPTDSPLGFAAFRVAAISKVNEDGTGRKVSDRNAIVVNSEWSQTINGKDHDADDISLIPFHQNFWKLNHFKDLVSIARQIPDAYIKAIKEQVIKVLDENNTVIKTQDGQVITSETLKGPDGTRLIFGEPMVKEKYTLLLNGAPSHRTRRVFPMMGQSFIQLDSMYIHSPAGIINERLYHSSSSSINMRAMKVPLVLIGEGGKLSSNATLHGDPIDLQADFEVRNPKWMRTNVNHQDITHAEVDFPNKTTRLAYNSDPAVLAQQFWGLQDDKLVKLIGTDMRPMYQAIRDFQKLLFEDAFNLARRRDTELFEKLGYYETFDQLVRAKNRLETLARNDKVGLKTLYHEVYERQVQSINNRYQTGTPLHSREMVKANQRRKFMEGFIDQLQVDNVYAYPLFNTIRNIDINKIPQPGNQYKDHLINQVVATGETLQLYPEVAKRYSTAITKAPLSFFIVGETAAEKTAKEILRLLGHSGQKNSRLAVASMLKDKQRMNERISKTRPANRRKLKEKLEDFDRLNPKVGQPYEPFLRGGNAYNVDGETIAFSRIPREFDFFEGRAGKKYATQEEYWDNQLRMAREEAITIMHGFDVEPEVDEKRTELKPATEERRTAHQRVYPLMWKQILESPFLFFQGPASSIKLQHPTGTAILENNGRGEILIDFNGQKRKHTELKADDPVYKLLTERQGFWEGISDTSYGTNNRAEMRSLLRIARNLSMDTRFELVKDFIGKRVYGPNVPFTSMDQVAFWISLISQTSHQAMQDKKALGFIVNQSAYDPKRPMKYQNNHLALDLMAIYEESMIDAWLQLYAIANKQKQNMVFEDQAHVSPQQSLRHYFSAYRDDLEAISKDTDFVSFYKKMKNSDWKEGLKGLRGLLKNIVTLKALSENGVYYEDLVNDLNKLTDQQFFNKYKGVDVEDINLAIERYMGKQAVDSFIRQQAGEDAVEFRTKNNILALYWSLNGARKREARKEAKMGKISKFFTSFIGYDLTTLLGEKQTEILTPKDQEIGIVLGENGPVPFTTNEVQISRKSQPTRTWLPVGKSSIAAYKTQQANRTLNQNQIDMNSQTKLYEDVVKLSSNTNYRTKWRNQYSHRTKTGQATSPHTDRTRMISRLMDQIPETDNKQLEIARKEIFELAENLRSRGKIWIEVQNGRPVYNIQLNKVYRYKNLDDLITNHLGKATAQKKLQLIGALDIRMMYDVMVPQYLQSILEYLEQTREALNEGTSFAEAQRVDQMVQKYRDMLDSLVKRQGDYMPHMFPESEYRLLWMSGFLKHETDRIKNEIREAKTNGSDPVLAAIEDQQTILNMAYERADNEYNRLSHEWNRGSIIPNFLPRQFPRAEGYTKSDPTIHFNYSTKLTEGLKKDVLKADWFIYQKEAREAGERTSIMELTRQWYAKQINDEELNSEMVTSDHVQPGMNVHFNHQSFLVRRDDPTLTVGTGVVSGVVRKVTADEIILDLDLDRVKWEIKQDLERWNTISDKMRLVASSSRASQRQHIVLQNLLSRGFLSDKDFEDMDLSQLTMLDAADLTVKGLKRAYRNPEQMARYKWTDIWTTNDRGDKVKDSIRRYARSGALETMRTRERELHNLQLMGGRYDGVVPINQYNLIKFGLKGADIFRKGLKRISGLAYMGMASMFKARLVNEFGARVNNLIDAPIYNYGKWKEGMEIWDRIKHGKIELMDPDDAKLYKTLVSLGLTEDNSLLAIALEAANIKPEDMLVQDAKPAALKWLFTLWQDAVGYKETSARIRALKEEILKTHDLNKKNALGLKLLAEQKIWQAKVEGILEKGKVPTEEEKVLAWRKVEALEKAGALTKINIAEEQGIDLNMATRMVGSVAWKSFYTSNLGVGFQAKAERMRIPAFFIGYTTALDMGYTEDEAIQFGINAIELRHAFYGAASKQYGANTEMGTVLFQYSQYQYNALSKAIRIIHEAIPQMLRLGANRPAEVGRLQHLYNMTKLVQTAVDAQGNALKRGEVTLKEINLTHGIMMKVLWTGAMMQLGTRVFYGITNFQDPVGQTLYKTFDYIITLMQSGFDPGDEDDRERLIWAIQDGAMIAGLLYKYQLQALTQVPDKGFVDTFYKGRAEDTMNFLWRTGNTMQQVAYELGATDQKLHKKEKTYFDVPWLTDDLFTGIKLMGWSPADNEPGSYEKRGFFGSRAVNAFTAGRYVETNNKGISGFGQGKSRTRFTFLFDPQSYVPYLDRIFTGK